MNAHALAAHHPQLMRLSEFCVKTGLFASACAAGVRLTTASPVLIVLALIVAVAALEL